MAVKTDGRWAETSPGGGPQCTASCSIRPGTHQKRNSTMHRKFSSTFVLTAAAGALLTMGCVQSESGPAADTVALSTDSVGLAPTTPAAPTTVTADMRIEGDTKARALHVLTGGRRTA